MTTPQFRNRVSESSSTPGYGPYVVNGASELGRRRFSTAYSVGDDTIPVTIEDLFGNWLVALCTLTSANTITIDEVLDSSADGAPVNFGAGLLRIFVDLPASVLMDLLAGSTVTAPVAISGTAPAGTVGTPYTTTFSASGGTTPYAFSISSGTLPAGLTLNTSTGLVSGTPTTAATSTFVIRVLDSLSASAFSASQSVAIATGGGSGSLTVAGTAGAGTVGTSYSATFTATGGTSPYVYSVGSGTLPAGVTLNTSTGVISGTPSAAATSTFVIHAHDAAGTPLVGDSGSQSVVIAATGGGLPGAPTSVTLAPTGVSGELIASWVAPAGTITGYTVTFYNTSNIPVNTVGAGGSATSAFQTSFTDGTLYYAKVYATNASGDGPNSTASSTATPGVIADTKPRYTTGTAAATLSTLFAAATDVPGGTNGSRTGGPFTVSPAASNYGYVFILQSACATGGGIPGGSYGATFMDSLGAGGWQGAGLAGNNSGASPSQSYSSITYVDSTGTYVVFRQDYANSMFTGSIT